VLHDGCWYDEVLMSIIDHEWVAADRLADERSQPGSARRPLAGSATQASK
jgi:hypothetical protein